MLSRFQRLSRNRIEYLFKKGKKTGNNYFTSKFLSTPRTSSRFCIVISAKVEPKAVKRNLLRRRTYEAIRLHQNILSSNYDIILIIKPAFLTLKYPEIVQVIINYFQNLK